MPPGLTKMFRSTISRERCRPYAAISELYLPTQILRCTSTGPRSTTQAPWTTTFQYLPTRWPGLWNDPWHTKVDQVGAADAVTAGPAVSPPSSVHGGSERSGQPFMATLHIPSPFLCPPVGWCIRRHVNRRAHSQLRSVLLS